MSRLVLTETALGDIEEIRRYSVERWGDQLAERYLSDLEAGLTRLQADLSLFRPRHDYAGRLHFYPVRKHVIVGEVMGQVGYVLGVWQASMDFVDRLPELEPQLLAEIELMSRRARERVERVQKRGK